MDYVLVLSYAAEMLKVIDAVKQAAKLYKKELKII
jgi:hypothetical protein